MKMISLYYISVSHKFVSESIKGKFSLRNLIGTHNTGAVNIFTLNFDWVTGC